MAAITSTPAFEEDYRLLCKAFGNTGALTSLLGEQGAKYSDLALRFSPQGKVYPAHKIVLYGSFLRQLSEEQVTKLAHQAPLDENLEDFLLDCLYGKWLPGVLPLKLSGAFKLFAWAMEWQCPRIQRLAMALAHLLMKHSTDLAKALRSALDTPPKHAALIVYSHFAQYPTQSIACDIESKLETLRATWSQAKSKWKATSFSELQPDSFEILIDGLRMVEELVDTTVLYGAHKAYRLHGALLSAKWSYFEKHAVEVGPNQFMLKLEIAQDVGSEVSEAIVEQLISRCYGQDNYGISPATALAYMAKAPSWGLSNGQFVSFCLERIKSQMRLPAILDLLLVASQLGIFDDNFDSSTLGHGLRRDELLQRIHALKTLASDCFVAAAALPSWKKLPKSLQRKIQHNESGESYNPSASPSKRAPVIYVKTVTGDTLTVGYSREKTVTDLHEALYAQGCLRPHEQRLIENGRSLFGARTLDHSGIESGDTLHLLPELKGG